VDSVLDGLAGPVAPAQKTLLERVGSNTERLTRLIADLLDLARIEAGRVDFRPSRLSLRALVGDVVEELRDPARHKGIDLAGEVPAGDVAVVADRDKLLQILLNLTHNAVKFTPAGGRVRVRAASGERGGAVIAVEDTGPGIVPEDVEPIFEKFHQAGDPATGPRGSGLGLTIARKLVEMHGGTIGVTSEPGRGSVFVVTLPAGHPEAA
jgi:signal transduction histidine kinase